MTRLLARRVRHTTPWLVGMLALAPAVAAQSPRPLDTRIEAFRAEVAARLRADAVLVELEALEREIETETTQVRDDFVARQRTELARVETALDGAIDGVEEELHATEKHATEVLERWDSESAQAVFDTTFEPMADRFWTAAEDLSTRFDALAQRWSREREVFFGAGFEALRVVRLDDLAQTRLAFAQRLEAIERALLDEARSLSDAEALTSAARTRLLRAAARRAMEVRPPGTALTATRQAAEAIRQELLPGRLALDASLAALDADLASFTARFEADLNQRRRELANLKSHYQ